MLYLIVPLVPVLLLAGFVAWALRPIRTVGPTTPSQAWTAAEKHARRVVLVAWLVLLLAPALATLAVFSRGLDAVAFDDGGPLIATLPLLGGIAFLAVGAVGELTWPRPVGAVRRAPLARRRIRDVAPRGLAVLAGVWAALLALLLVLCGVVAGTGGRSLSYQHADEFAPRTTSPFPGWYYGRSVGLALVVVVAATVVVLALVARRPVVSDTAPHADTTLRRTSCRRVLAGVQLVLASTLAGCLFFAARSVVSVEPAWADAFGPGSSATIGIALEYVALALPFVSAVVAVRGSRAPVTAPGLTSTTALAPA